MSTTLETVARNAACNAVVDLVDQGSGAGKLKIREGSTVLCVVTLSDPAFGNAATGVATASGLPLSGVGIAPGDADNFQITDSADTLLWSGDVTATGGGGALTLDNVNIAVSQVVNISSLTHNAPAS